MVLWIAHPAVADAQAALTDGMRNPPGDPPSQAMAIRELAVPKTCKNKHSQYAHIAEVWIGLQCATARPDMG